MEDVPDAVATDNETTDHTIISFQSIVYKQQQIIDQQAALIKTLGQELAHHKEELAQSNAIKKEVERLARLTETAEEQANEQVVSLEQEVIRLTEILQAHGIESAGL